MKEGAPPDFWSDGEGKTLWPTALVLEALFLAAQYLDADRRGPAALDERRRFEASFFRVVIDVFDPDALDELHEEWALRERWSETGIKPSKGDDDAAHNSADREVR